MSLYAVENFPLRVIEELRRLGHDVLSALEDGKANQAVTDADLLARQSNSNAHFSLSTDKTSNDCTFKSRTTLA
jgi:hypothetical protein